MTTGRPWRWADLEVGGSVARRDLECAGAELRVDGCVADDGDGFVEDGEEHLLAVEVLVAGIVGVHGHAGVAHHRFGAGGGDGDAIAAIDGGVVDIIQAAIDVPVLHLQVGEGGGAARAPVDDALAAVDEALAVEVDEDVADGPAGAGVQGEALAGPVAGDAEAVVLGLDAASIARHPVPYALDELLAAQVVAGQALLGQLALDDDLGGDAGVVDAGEPQGGVAPHTAPAGERVLDRGALGVAQVEFAGDVGGRLDDDEGRPRGVRVGGEVAAVQPLLVARLLHGAGVVGRREALGPGGGGAHRRTRILGSAADFVNA